jgi:hypothetical protein
MKTCPDCRLSETDYQTDAVMAEAKKTQLESAMQHSLGIAVLEIYIFLLLLLMLIVLNILQYIF